MNMKRGTASKRLSLDFSGEKLLFQLSRDEVVIFCVLINDDKKQSDHNTDMSNVKKDNRYKLLLGCILNEWDISMTLSFSLSVCVKNFFMVT